MAEMERFLTDASIVAKTAAAAPAADAWIPGAEYEDLASRPPTERVGNRSSLSAVGDASTLATQPLHGTADGVAEAIGAAAGSAAAVADVAAVVAANGSSGALHANTNPHLSLAPELNSLHRNLSQRPDGNGSSRSGPAVIAHIEKLYDWSAALTESLGEGGMVLLASLQRERSRIDG